VYRSQPSVSQKIIREIWECTEHRGFLREYGAGNLRDFSKTGSYRRIHRGRFPGVVSGDSFRAPGDWVFATNSNRAGKKRGKQPLWLCKVMSHHIQPIAKKLGITKHIGWHTFRRTYSSILKDNGEDVKVVQELLRHASTKVTLDVYAQALTPAKRAAQRKVVQMIRGESPCTASVPRKIGVSA